MSWSPSIVVVDVVLGLPDPIGQRRDALAGEALDVVLHLAERGLHRLLAVLVDQPQDLALADPRRLGLGLQVADDVAGRAGVRRDHAHDVAEVAAPVPDPDRRDPQPLAEVVARGDVERAGDAAAHVGPMAARLRVGDHLVADEDRPDDARVVEVRAARVGVVDQEHVAGMDVARELLDHGLRRVVQRADVDGDVLIALHDRVAARIAQRRGEVARIDDEGVAGAQDLLAHLVDRVDERVLQHLEGDRVERCDPARGRRRRRGAHVPASSSCMRMLSHSSTSARQPGGTTTVESSCSTIAGPWIVVPAEIVGRS